MRLFRDAPDAVRCTASILLSDSSKARCGRYQKVGTLCTQHARLAAKQPRTALVQTRPVADHRPGDYRHGVTHVVVLERPAGPAVRVLCRRVQLHHLRAASLCPDEALAAEPTCSTCYRRDPRTKAGG